MGSALDMVCLGPFAAAFPTFGVPPLALVAWGATPSLGVRVLTCKKQLGENMVVVSVNGGRGVPPVIIHLQTEFPKNHPAIKSGVPPSMETPRCPAEFPSKFFGG